MKQSILEFTQSRASVGITVLSLCSLFTVLPCLAGQLTGIDKGWQHLDKWNVDINSDGFTDYCRFVGDGGNLFLSCDIGNGNPYGYNFRPSRPDFGYASPARELIDVNADGRLDFCRCTGSQPNLKFSCALGEQGGFSSNQYGYSIEHFACTGTRDANEIPLSELTQIDTGNTMRFYGRWCGPGHPKGTNPGKPIDRIDAACFSHDEAYRQCRAYESPSEKSLCQANADTRLLKSLLALRVDSLSDPKKFLFTVSAARYFVAQAQAQYTKAYVDLYLEIHKALIQSLVGDRDLKEVATNVWRCVRNPLKC